MTLGNASKSRCGLAIGALLTAVAYLSFALLYRSLFTPSGNGFALYLGLVTLVYVPVVYWTGLDRFRLALLTLTASNILRQNVYLTGYGMFPGVDYHKEFAKFTMLLQEGHLYTAEPSTYTFLHSFSVPFEEPLTAVNYALLTTAALLPVVIYILVHRPLFERRLAIVAALIVSTDFIHLLFSVASTRENISLILTIVVLFVILRYLQNDGRHMRGALLTIGVVGTVLVVTAHYTTIFLELLLVSAFILMSLLARPKSRLPVDPHVIPSKLHRASFRHLSLLLLIFAAVSYAWMANVDTRVFRRHTEVVLGFAADFLFGSSLFDIGHGVGGDETAAFIGRNLILAAHQWLYRLCMLFGAGILLYRARRATNARITFVLVGVGMTGLPVVWLFLPVLSNMLHSGRVARFALPFYSLFVAVLILAGFYQLRTRDLFPGRVRAFLLALILLSAFVIPSAVKSTENFDFERGISDSLKRTTHGVGTTHQLATWQTVTGFTNGKVNAPKQFRMMALMEDLHRISVLPATAGEVTVVKRRSVETGQVIGKDAKGIRLVSIDVGGTAKVYSNGDYVALYGNVSTGAANVTT